MRKLLLAAAACAALAACQPQERAPASTAAETGPHVVAANDIERGRYLIKIGGCNDCHTAGYLERGMGVPEKEWLTGSLGFNGAWGTSYPANLRLSVQSADEDGWVSAMRTRNGLPPMPWVALKEMSENDLRAIYKYIHSLGPAGEPMPAALAPGVTPPGVYFFFMPVFGKPPEAAPPPPPG